MSPHLLHLSSYSSSHIISYTPPLHSFVFICYLSHALQLTSPHRSKPKSRATQPNNGRADQRKLRPKLYYKQTHKREGRLCQTEGNINTQINEKINWQGKKKVGPETKLKSSTQIGGKLIRINEKEPKIK